ncbi:hypothetical protein I5Q34_29575 [Streptomyces sp. AV19]|nr:hypothetical protein [Streptomyces sp. AV19]
MVPREGNWAVDTRDNRVGQVMKKRWSSIRLCAPNSGGEWECPPDKVRIATKAELQEAGAWRDA